MRLKNPGFLGYPKKFQKMKKKFHNWKKSKMKEKTLMVENPKNAYYNCIDKNLKTSYQN